MSAPGESGGMSESARIEEMEAKLAEVQRAKDEADALASMLDRKSAAESAYRAHARKLGPVFYIYPLFPAVLSLVTIFVGSVIVNSTPAANCGQPQVKLYIGGNIVLSYVLILFYTAMLVGVDIPLFFCRLRWTVRSFLAPTLFAILYCLIGLVWNILGTVWYVDNAPSCKTTAPELYNMHMAEVIFFWVSFGAVTILLIQRWFFNKYADKLRRKREHEQRLAKLREEDERIEFEEKQAELDRKADADAKAAEDAKRKETEDKRKAEEAALAAQYGESSDEDNKKPAAAAGASDDDEEEDEDESEDESDDDESDDDESDDDESDDW
mmetsp:Transcript_16158/g.38218  ORF Transcript_16158/g.38218 Transcript_16158/m.38218 type:complete len:326 (+) Transcript_16158:174-1151(+)